MMVAECKLLGWGIQKACNENEAKRPEFKKVMNSDQENFNQLRKLHESIVCQNNELVESISAWVAKRKIQEAEEK